MIEISGFIFGAILGSFIKVLADRSINQKSFWGRSYCTYCKKTLRWYDLLPIFSYIFLGGKCRYCRKSINIEYLLVEILTAVLISFLFFRQFQSFPGFSDYFKLAIFTLPLLINIFFVTVLIVVFLTDLKKMFIPDRVILPSLIVGLVLVLLNTVSKIGYLYYVLSGNPVGRQLLPPQSDYFQRHAFELGQSFLSTVLTAAGIGGFFLLLIIITRGKGMGGGDVKLGAFIGLMLGSPFGIVAIVLSFIMGAMFSLILILTKRKHFGQAIPFGPFLVLGSYIALFWGKQIINWYFNLTI
ncbi:prepilin peptidase [Candidatus Daviesbacteria bacterium]|nr:prepilin peptidase [Candidatus Daviesbacteria bacterium]